MGSTATPMKFKVALIQMKPKPNDPPSNFEHASTQIRHAATQGASLAVLPEYHLTGFDPTSAAFIPACQTSHSYVAQYKSLAKELSICIVPGTIVLTPNPEDACSGTTYTSPTAKPTLLNIAYFIDFHGSILGEYTKTNLWHPEREHLTSSIERHHRNQPQSHEECLPEPHAVIDTPFGKVGLLVCWDIAFPEAFRSLLRQGAEMFIVPTYWMASDMMDEGLRLNAEAEKLFLSTTIVSRSFENTAAIVFCNAGGPKEEGFIGISQVALPIVGAVKGSFADSEEGVRVVEVDMGIVKLAEENYKVRADLNSENWHYRYEK
ncbi:hypothetical protein R6Q59_010029 [Mikania micrantha]